MKKPARVPGTRRRGGWRHFGSLLHEKRGTVLAEGERVVAALPVPGDAFSDGPRELGFEVRGSGSSWRVWYPSAEFVPSAIEVYDAAGNLKDMLLVHGAGTETRPLAESGFSSTPGLSEQEALEEAVAYARFLGATDVKVVRLRSHGRYPGRYLEDETPDLAGMFESRRAHPWGYWSDGVGELVPFCPECARCEFASDARASGSSPLVRHGSQRGQP